MPRRFLPPAVALGLVIVALPALAVAGVRVLPGKDDDAGRRGGGSYLPAPVPCDQAVQELTLTVGLAEAYVDSTEGESQVDGYACRPEWEENGPEHVYVLTAAEDLILDLGLASNVPNDHDLVLLSDCDSDSCLVQANTELSAVLTQGTTVYLVVDGFAEAAGVYTLNLATRPIGIPESICEGDAVPVDLLALESLSIELADSLVGRANLVSIYDCAPYTVRGGEVWYAMSIAPADTDTVGTGHGRYLEVAITAATLQPDLDLVLWLFGGCGPEAECLAFVDAEVAGGAEILEWSNPVPEGLTLYLAVDCIRAAEAGRGNYVLSVDTVVPARARSLSGVRKGFR